MVTAVLDPGHGGTTTVGGSSPNNATGPGGLLEKTVTLQVAKAAKKAFTGSGVTVKLTRTADNNLGIGARAKVAKDADAEAFVSIHFNAPGGTAPAQGTETWIGVGHTAISRQLADAVQTKVVAATGHRDRGVKVRNVSGVIKPSNHKAKTANCLVEISFLSLQPAEEARLKTTVYIDALGKAIADAVLAYLRARGLIS